MPWILAKPSSFSSLAGRERAYLPPTSCYFGSNMQLTCRESDLRRPLDNDKVTTWTRYPTVRLNGCAVSPQCGNSHGPSKSQRSIVTGNSGMSGCLGTSYDERVTSGLTLPLTSDDAEEPTR